MAAWFFHRIFKQEGNSCHREAHACSFGALVLHCLQVHVIFSPLLWRDISCAAEFCRVSSTRSFQHHVEMASALATFPKVSSSHATSPNALLFTNLYLLTRDHHTHRWKTSRVNQHSATQKDTLARHKMIVQMRWSFFYRRWTSFCIRPCADNIFYRHRVQMRGSGDMPIEEEPASSPWTDPSYSCLPPLPKNMSQPVVWWGALHSI